MDFLLIVLYIVAFLMLCFWINKNHIKTLPNYTLPVLFLVKTAYAFLFIYIYTYYYGSGELTGDVGDFFRQSKVLYSVYDQSPSDFFKFIFGMNNEPEQINKFLEATTHWNRGESYQPNDSRNVLRVNALLLFISNGQAVIHFIILSFASFMGGVDLFHWVKKKSNLPPLLLLMLLTLTPSLAFWSSSIIKEPLMILGTYLFIRGVFDNLSFTGKTWRIVLGILLTLGFKPYVLICLLAALIYYFIFSKFFKKQWLALLTYGLIGLAVLLGTGYADRLAYIVANQQEDFLNLRNGGLYLNGDEEHFYYIPYDEIDKHFELENGKAKLIESVEAYHLKKNENYERFPFQLNEVGTSYPIHLNLTKTGSPVKITPIRDNFWQMLMNIPEALFNSFFQPIPKNEYSNLQALAFIENILYILAALLIFIFFPKSLSFKDKRVVITLGLFTAFMAMVVGWITPVSGAIVRYIIPAHIAILVIFAIKTDYEKVKIKGRKLLGKSS